MSGGDKNYNKQLLLLKVETTEGTDAAPTPGANALQVLDLTPQFMDADFKTRNLAVPYFGAKPTIPSSVKRGATFNMEMTGSGTAGTAPAWMIAAAFAAMSDPTIVATTSAAIQPITDNIKSATAWQYFDDLLIKTIGARASIGFTIEDDEIPLLNFSFLGRAPSALASQATPSAATFTGYPTPLIASTENTSIMVDGYACGVRRFTLNSNADLQYRSLINPQDRVIVADRPWSGELVIQVPDLTAKDYFAKVGPGTTMAVTVTHGAAAGNIVAISVPKLLVTGNVTISEEQGRVMATFPCSAIPVSGNDEIVFTAT